MGGKGVFRYETRTWTLGFMHSICSHISIGDEISVLCEGLELVVVHHIVPLQIKIDAQEVINLLQRPHSKFLTILLECRWLLHS